MSKVFDEEKLLASLPPIYLKKKANDSTICLSRYGIPALQVNNHRIFRALHGGNNNKRNFMIHCLRKKSEVRKVVNTKEK